MGCLTYVETLFDEKLSMLPGDYRAGEEGIVGLGYTSFGMSGAFGRTADEHVFVQGVQDELSREESRIRRGDAFQVDSD